MIHYHPIFLGSSCDNQCRVCPTNDQEKAVDFHAAVKQIENLSDRSNIMFVGGEPLVYKDLFAIVAQARQQGAIRIKMVTNGRQLADPNVLGRLLHEGCRIFEIKLFGASPPIHDFITGVPGSLDQTVHGLANLEEAAGSEEFEDGLFIINRIEISQHNLEDLADIMGLAASFGADRILFVRRGIDFPITQGAQMVSHVMRTAALNRIWTLSRGFPPCVMKGCETHLCELVEPILRNSNLPKGCRPCLCRGVCNGPPQKYVQKYGTDEFKPVRIAPYMDDVINTARLRSRYEKK